ncbi:MAG: hypothetical protein V2J11_10290, partial [Desulfofustis sp.]|nr:hypothetical protein [Desulfofustis sp.]
MMSTRHRHHKYAGAIVAAGLLSFWSIGHGETVVKAQPDECYNGIGGYYEEKLEGRACQEGWLEKRNQSYGWALTSWGKDVWVGTGANVSCIAATAGSIFSGVIPSFQVPGEAFFPGGPEYPLVPPFTGNVGQPGNFPVTAEDYFL